MNEFSPLLYYSPGACSMAVHVALVESGLPHRIERRTPDKGETRTAEFLSINPLALVPVLEIAPGRHLTEVIAILTWLDGRAPKRLLPEDPERRVRAYEWLSLLATTAHTAFGRINNPEHYLSTAGAHDDLREHARKRFSQVLLRVDPWLTEPFALGAEFSAVDAYQFVFYCWARYARIDLEAMPRVRAHGMRMLERPSVLAVIEREGLLEAFAAISAAASAPRGAAKEPRPSTPAR